MLLKAIAAFFILVYIHISFSQTPATCLEHLKTEGWPKDGILRVEILRPGEVKIPEGAEDLSEELTIPRSNHKGGMVSIDPSTTLPHEEHEINDPNYKSYLDAKKTVAFVPDQVNETTEEMSSLTENFQMSDPNLTESIEKDVSESIRSTLLADTSTFNGDFENADMNTKETYTNETLAKLAVEQRVEEFLKTNVPEVEKLMNAGKFVIEK